MPQSPAIYMPREEDFRELTQVWEASVRATHDFLPDVYISTLKNLLLKQYLYAVTLFCTRDKHSRITGFAGISRGKLEMLFIAPEHRGEGLGRQLLTYAVKHYNIHEVDVNEQNPQALGFYLKHGFEVVSRAEVDGLGQPYPMLSMHLVQLR